MPNTLRRVAVLGGIRIPFARANGAYNEASNQDMLTAAMTALVQRFELKDKKIGEVAAGAEVTADEGGMARGIKQQLGFEI